MLMSPLPNGDGTVQVKEAIVSDDSKVALFLFYQNFGILSKFCYYFRTNTKLYSKNNFENENRSIALQVAAY